MSTKALLPASMRPRPLDRGERAEAFACRAVDVDVSRRQRPPDRGERYGDGGGVGNGDELQCGHGLSTVENGTVGVGAEAPDGASMRPRPLDRGERLEVAGTWTGT